MNSWKEELKFVTYDGVTVNVGTKVHWVITYTTDGRTEYLYDLTLGEGHKDLIFPESRYKIFALYDEAMKYVREKNIPEYVELLKGWSIDNEFVGGIFDTKIDFQKQFKKFKGITSSWNWATVLKKWPECFKPSTKEAYLKQDIKPVGIVDNSVTITVPGMVTAVTTYGSEVKINYQIK